METFLNATNTNATNDELNLQEAEDLRRRARELYAEAQAMELALKDTRSEKTKQKETESNELINRLFPKGRPLTPSAIARVLREERWSPDQVWLVLEGLHERQLEASAESIPPAQFQIGDTRNSNVGNETEAQLAENYIQCLVQAAELLDAESSNPLKRPNTRWSGRVGSSLKSRLNELRRAHEQDFQRRLEATVNAAVNSNTTVQDYMRKTLGLPSIEEPPPTEVNMSRVMERVAMVPMWVPSSLLEYMAASQATIAPNDAKAIKENVLAGTSFFCTSSETIPSAAIYRGNLRSSKGVIDPEQDPNVTAKIFEDIQWRLNMNQNGLSDRVQLFFLLDPEWRPKRDELEPKPKPVVLALPKAVIPDDSLIKGSFVSTVVKKAALPLSLLTTFAYSVGCYALNPKFFESVVNQQDMTVLSACVPVLLGIVAVQLVSELAHFVVAKARRIKVGRPLPLPSTQLGCFGCITPLRSFPANRAALLDFALSGPLAAMVLSIVLMITGIYQTVHASEVALSHFPVVPMALLKGSFLTGSLLTLLAPKGILLPLSQPIPISPLFMIGFSGLLSSALNLLPIFRLDGGRAITAAMGARFGAVASAGTLLFMLSLAISGQSALAFAWGLIIVIFQRRPEIPARDEVTEVDQVRLGGWMASLFTAILALAPFPGGNGFL